MNAPHQETWREALVAPGDENLSALLAAARRERIPVRCHERVGAQVVLVIDEVAACRVRALHAQLRRAGRLDRGAVPDAPARSAAGPVAWIAAATLAWPVTLGTLAIVFAVFALSLGQFRAGFGPWLLLLPVDALVEYARDGDRLAALLAPLAAGEAWRWLTPALLHDGPMHLLGNCVLLYWFGIRIETVDGQVRMLALVLGTMLSGNLVQFLGSGTPFFGGMSGVVYGLFGYAFVAPRVGGPVYAVHPGLFGLMALLLGVTSLGLFEPFGIHVGNGAHWGGLLGGCLFALLRHGVGSGRADHSGSRR